MAVEVVEVQRLAGAGLVAFNVDLPTADKVEEGHNITLSGWALTPDGPPRTVRLDLVGASVLLNGPLTQSRLLGSRRGVGERFNDIPRADESGFLFYCSLVGLPPELEVLVSAELADGKYAGLAHIRARRDPIRPSPGEGIVPVLLDSPGRSGSTWLTQLVGAHPEGVSYRSFQREPRVASYWMEVFRALSGPIAYSRAIHPEETGSPDWWIAERDWLPQWDVASDPHLHRWLACESVDETAAFCRARIEGFYRNAACEEGRDKPTFFIERSVGTRLTSLLHELFPRISELHLIRDPRDVLASRLSFIAKTGLQQFGRDAAFDDEHYVRELFSREMRHSLLKWEDASERALLVRYEELLEQPEEELRRIFEHLGVDASPSTVLQVLDRAKRLRPDRQEWHVTTPPGRNSIGRWRQDLPDPLLQACEEALGDVITRLGYQPAANTA